MTIFMWINDYSRYWTNLPTNVLLARLVVAKPTDVTVEQIDL